MTNGHTQVRFAPETGSKRPFELLNTSGTRVLGSFETEAAANQKKKIFDAAIDFMAEKEGRGE